MAVIKTVDFVGVPAESCFDSGVTSTPVDH